MPPRYDVVRILAKAIGKTPAIASDRVPHDLGLPKELYGASQGEPGVVDVPPMNYLTRVPRV